MMIAELNETGMKRFNFLCATLAFCLSLTVASGAMAAGNADEQQVGPNLPPRFIDNHNGTVTDSSTGLVWLKDGDCFGEQTWDNAVALSGSLANGQCGLSDGSRAGEWRLPDREELATLINRQQRDSSAWLNLQGFSKVRSNFYWTSTESDVSTTIAWFADMGRGGGVHKGGTMFPYYVWPVRGGK